MWQVLRKICTYLTEVQAPHIHVQSCGMEGLVPGRHSCMSRVLGSDWGSKHQKLERSWEKGSHLFQPIRKQKCLVTCTNHMFMDETWNECTIPVNGSETVKKIYLQQNIHALVCSRQKLGSGAKLAHNGHVKSMYIARHPFLPTLNLFLYLFHYFIKCMFYVWLSNLY